MVACPQCASPATEVFGALPVGRSFAGVEQNPPLRGGSLARCHQCFLMFRTPIFPEEEYVHLYEAGSHAVWRSRSHRRDHQLAATALLESVSSGSVLDVGCFDGAFLRRIPQAFKRFGVEPGAAAAAAARSHDIAVLGKSLGDISANSGFDAIVAIDVIEHVLEPLVFLKQCAALVRPGGILVLSTGDADSKAFGRFRERFWYAAPPEHVRFVGANWFRLHSTVLGLEVLRLTPFRHRSWKPVIEACLAPYRLLQAGLRVLGQPAGDRRFVVGWPGLFQDHILAVLRKPA